MGLRGGRQMNFDIGEDGGGDNEGKEWLLALTKIG